MAKNKKRKNRSAFGHQPRNAARGWSAGGIALALFLALGIAGAIGYSLYSDAGSQGEKVEKDKYGRSPEHAHYRHDHP